MIVECRKCGKEFKIPNNYYVNRGYYFKIVCPYCKDDDSLEEDVEDVV